MAEARNLGKSFSELSDVSRRVCIDQIIFRSCAIGGCSLPQTEMFAGFIAEELEKFIYNFGFEDYTEAEFLLALQLNAMGKIHNPSGEDIEQVVFVGNCVNVSYLGKIFKNYAIIRNNLDSKLRNIANGF